MSLLVQNLLEKGETSIYDAMVRALESIMLPAVLSETRRRLQEACDILGIARNTLKAKMKDHCISIDQRISSRTESPDQNLTTSH
ncbi:helix-turn-helix domain-containing protein [Oligoflexus sp.]|uniref:helix-turn-helix domain-containing protein n=1 Tax=Oligoflexus sp. TaxID=1971216 RepID=UPI0039C94C47